MFNFDRQLFNMETSAEQFLVLAKKQRHLSKKQKEKVVYHLLNNNMAKAKEEAAAALRHSKREELYLRTSNRLKIVSKRMKDADVLPGTLERKLQKVDLSVRLMDIDYVHRSLQVIEKILNISYPASTLPDSKEIEDGHEMTVNDVNVEAFISLLLKEIKKKQEEEAQAQPELKSALRKSGQASSGEES